MRGRHPRLEGPLSRPGHTDSHGAKAHDNVALIKAIPGIGPRRTPFILSDTEILISGLEGQPASEVLPTLPRVLGQIAPELLPEIGDEMLPLLRLRCERCHGCMLLQGNGFTFDSDPAYTLRLLHRENYITQLFVS